DALARASYPDAARLAGRCVHVQQRADGDLDVLELLDEPRGERGREVEGEDVVGAEVAVAVRVLRDGDRRDAEHDALERGRHRARVGDVVAQVHAVVDAGDDQVGR